MRCSRVSVMLVGRGEESSTRTTISSLMALITNSSRSEGGQQTNKHSAHNDFTIRGATLNLLKNRYSCINYNNHNDCRGLMNVNRVVNVPYSVLSPQSFTLFASYWAFFFRRHALQKHDRWAEFTHGNRKGSGKHDILLPNQHLDYNIVEVSVIVNKQLSVDNAYVWITYLDASLFFSLRDRGRAVSGSSLTGVKSLITLFSLRSSVPICSSLRGLGVRSSTSVRRDFFSIYFPSWGEKKRWLLHKNNKHFYYLNWFPVVYQVNINWSVFNNLCSEQ